MILTHTLTFYTGSCRYKCDIVPACTIASYFPLSNEMYRCHISNGSVHKLGLKSQDGSATYITKNINKKCKL